MLYGKEIVDLQPSHPPHSGGSPRVFTRCQWFYTLLYIYF